MAGLATAEVAGDDEDLILPPGFRFHPTDEELITHYLFPKMMNGDLITRVMGEVDLNRVEPWDLPWKGKMGEKEWYFFCKKGRKYPTGLRTNRATDAGYWKATGKDKEIFRSKSEILIGMKKTLVFYQGRAPRGQKTNWVMHEFRSYPMQNHPNISTTDEWVISRVFKKSSGGKKVHISDLLKAPGSSGASRSSTDLPPVTDMAEGSRATCFSNSAEEIPGQSPPSSIKSEANSNTYYDPIMPRQQSLLSLLLENEEYFPVFAGGTSISGPGFQPINDHPQTHLLTTDSGGFDSPWNYSLLE